MHIFSLNISQICSFQHINDLSQNIDLQEILCKAEGIYHQVISASQLTDNIRTIIGLEIIQRPLSDDSIENELPDIYENAGVISMSPNREEVAYENAISASFF